MPFATGHFGSYNCDDIEQEEAAPVICSGLSIGACPSDLAGLLGALPLCGNEGAWRKCAQRDGHRCSTSDALR
jgi:hypothetical protein